VQFWALSCSLCKDHQPTLQAFKRTYGARGVRFVSVHMPRQESDTPVDQVEAVVEALGIEEPVAIDNEHAIGERFQTDGLWPVYFLFDETGKLRARAAGAAGPQAIERVLSRLAAGEDG
jgi:thiol-disulfide isomerase/thioredoxin